MNNIITKIEIDSFRSIWKGILKIDNINVFSGLNDVGKSNVLKAINLFFNNQTDFGTTYNFIIDYSKVSLAAAQRSNKKKQQVKIKIYFKVPTSFKSLQGEEVWVERIFDRFGKITENTSINDAKKKASITRLVNNIQYFYIPALKGPDVLRYILGEVGRRKLVSDKDIQNLNEQINQNIADLSAILSGSSINNETKFELPVLDVEDFWQKLNINTNYDEFTVLDTEINPSKKGKKDDLKKEYFQIPLQLRGDGVKSKFIPPLLQWIQKHEPKKFYIWGIDEPENSLEFKKAQEVADLYYSEYAKNTQLFLTSHSLAFIFAKNDDVSVIRCYKGIYGETIFENLDNLFKKNNKLNLADEIGALEIQKEVYEEWKKKDNEIKKLNEKIDAITKPIIFVEGHYDEDYFNKTLEVFNKVSSFPAEIKSIGYKDNNGSRIFTGKDNMEKAEKFLIAQPPKHKVILLYDVECGKQISNSGNLTVYCPSKFSGAKYKTGIEHLLIVPNSFDIENKNFVEERIKGDKKTTMPNKQKILTHVMSLPAKEQRRWLANIDKIIDELKKFV